MITAVVRTILATTTLLIATAFFASVVILAGLLGLRDRPGSIFDRAPRYWARLVLLAAGVRVEVHGDDNRRGARHIFVANHLSGFDVFAMAARLRCVKFVAKAELFRVPLLGRAMRYAGMIAVERQNQTRACASIHLAGEAIQNGASVILYPEGTRGRSYPVRPFKKGAFVLAIETQAPIVPVAIHGSLEVLPKGRWLVRPGRIDMHFLPPIETAGKTYDDRNALAAEARARIAECLASEHGVQSTV